MKCSDCVSVAVVRCGWCDNTLCRYHDKHHACDKQPTSPSKPIKLMIPKEST